MQMRPFFTLAFLLMLAFGLTACGGDSSSTTQTAPAAAPAPAPEIPAAITLEIAGNDQMQYDKKQLEVYAGQTVTLNLKHSGTLPKAAMGHNWVLLKQSADLQAFAMAAIESPETDYIPIGLKDEAIVYTEMIGGGEATSIEFPAPAAGTYKFLCTFPGHFAMMQGDFVVKARP